MPLNEHAYAYKALYQQRAAAKKQPLKVSVGETLNEPEPDIYKQMLRISASIRLIESDAGFFEACYQSTLSINKETLLKLKKQVLDLHRGLQHHGVLSKDQTCTGCKDVDFLVYQNAVTFERLEEVAQTLSDIEMEPVISRQSY